MTSVFPEHMDSQVHAHVAILQPEGILQKPLPLLSVYTKFIEGVDRTVHIKRFQ